MRSGTSSGVREAGASPALPCRVWSDSHPFSGTTGGLYEHSLRIATGLTKRGIGVGDVVAYQLPNWAEAVSLIWIMCTAVLVICTLAAFLRGT